MAGVPRRSDRGKFLGNLLISYGERRRRGTRAALCYPASRQWVAISVQTVVPRARLEAWIGEPAASSLVTTRPGASGRCRSRWEDCLHPPLPYPLPSSISGSFWRMLCLDASAPRHALTLPPPPCCRPSIPMPLVSISAPPSDGSVSLPARSRPPRPRARPRSCRLMSAASAPSPLISTLLPPGCSSAR